MLKVDADLMRTSGVQSGLDERGVIELLQDAIAGPGVATGLFGHSHALTVAGVTRNSRANFTGLMEEVTADNRDVEFVECPFGKLGGERDVRRVVLCHDETAASIFVESMNDPRASNATNAT